MLDIHRDRFKGLESKIADISAVLPFTPNQYTFLSIVAALAMLCFIILGDFIVALALFAAAAGLDLVDGAVARRKGLCGARGAYWDTIADRYVEAIFLFGLLLIGLPDFYLPAAAWIFLALAGSMMTTYVKAAAKEKGLSEVELKGGLMSRAERFALYGLILLFLIFGRGDWAIAAAALAALLANFTAIQRISAALSKNKPTG